jgi:hypothetical protein
MGLFARIAADDNTKISVHRFGAALREAADGGLTRQQIIDGFLLSGDEVTQLDAIIAAYAAIPSNTAAGVMARSAFLSRMEDVFLLIETGDYNEAKAKSRLGF